MLTVIIEDIDKKPDECWGCNFCAKEDGRYYCAVNGDWIHFGYGSINPDCPVKTLIQCKDCRYFSPNWRCLTWHQFTVEHGWCYRAERRPRNE